MPYYSIPLLLILCNLHFFKNCEVPTYSLPLINLDLISSLLAASSSTNDFILYIYTMSFFHQ
jgi:hypothetical protein